MIDYKTEKLLLKFLNHSSGGNIVSILGYTQKFEASVLNLDVLDSTPKTFVPKIDKVLQIRCNCRDNLYFNGMNNLSQRTYLTFKDVLKDFSKIEIEYNYSMYYCRD
jgi:hypothetical protein